MTVSKIQIISLALTHIGKNPVNDIAELGPQGTAVNLYYDIKLAAILRADYWPFANAIKELSLLTLEPIIDEWKYIFQLPADYLRANRVIPNSPYQIYEDKLYSNMNDLYLDYRFLPDPVRFTPDFVDYFALELASYLGRFSVVEETLMAEIKQATAKAHDIAIGSATKERPNRIITNSRLIGVRG